MDWKAIWDSICNFFTANVWNIVWFLVVLIGGMIVVKLLINVMRRILNATKMEKIAQSFLLAVVKVALYLVWALALLSVLGVQISGILTTLSALVLAVGVALQNNIANLANGIIIVATHMFKRGDYIAVNGVEGSIVEINFLFTTLVTPDNKKVTLPNSTIVNGEVINSGAHPKRRVDFIFSVAYETDVELVKKVVKDVMVSNGKVYLDPAPFCRLKVLGASSIDFAANCWVDSEDYWDVYYYVIEHVYNEFKRHNISVPYNQLEIRNRVDNVVMPYEVSELPARVEKVREENTKLDLETAGLSDILRAGKKRKANKKKTASESKTKKETKK